jgi:hypothetical protein
MFVIVGSLWPALAILTLGEIARQEVRRGVQNSGTGKDTQRRAGMAAMLGPRPVQFEKINLECFDGDEVLVTLAEKVFLEALDLEGWTKTETITLLSVIWHEQERRKS